MGTELSFSDTDFFYNNVNAPLKFDSKLCTLSDEDLRNKVIAALNIPENIVAGAMSSNEQQGGQCTWRKYDPKSDKGIDPKFVSNTWKLEYSKDKNGNPQCNCIRVNTEYIPTDSYSITTSTSLKGQLINPSTSYVCKNSIPITLKDTSINDIQLDPSNREQIIESTIKYYRSLCQNKEKAEQLTQTNSINQDSDLKYDDIKEYYNREYLNRINLGIGIVVTCGFIYMTVMSGNSVVPTPP